MKIKWIAFIGFLFINGLLSFSQRDKEIRLANFDQRKYHWGFILATNTSDFYKQLKPDYDFSDQLFSIDHAPVTAFTVGPIASLTLTKNLRLRTGIALSFQDRNLLYNFWQNGAIESFKKKVHSVYTDFPFHLKLRTDRINNFALYALTGAKYGYDWSSQRNVRQSNSFNDIVKISQHNIAYSVGGGLDLFLPYFKFGIDLRLDVGINNLLIQDNTIFASPLESLRSKMWQISLTFEG